MSKGHNKKYDFHASFELFYLLFCYYDKKKYSEKKSLREEGVVLGPILRYKPTIVEMSRQQELESPGYITSQSQEESDEHIHANAQVTFSTPTQSRISYVGNGATHSEQAFPSLT